MENLIKTNKNLISEKDYKRLESNKASIVIGKGGFYPKGKYIVEMFDMPISAHDTFEEALREALDDCVIC